MSLMMNNVFFFFCNQNNTIFLDQIGFRVKHKHIDHLIVRTIKSHSLIPNLMRDNK